MTDIKSGDLVVLKSGGPIMTVDTVNTDIFDDDKITGVLCVWFAGDKLERVRFDHRAIVPADLQDKSPTKHQANGEEATGDYKAVLDTMVGAMNTPADNTPADPLVVAAKTPKRVATRTPKRQRNTAQSVVSEKTH
jgi:uncharacterized protein YodC (DUF2158 family)